MVNQKDTEILTGSVLRMLGYAEADVVREASFKPFEDETLENALVSRANKTQFPDKQFKILTECRKSLSSDQPIATKGQIRTPQACAFLLATGQIVGGVAVNPLNSKNPNAENAIEIAYSEFSTQSSSGILKQSHIVAVALTTKEDQASECAMTALREAFSKLEIKGLIWVDPKTGKSEYSAQPFQISTPECA